MQATTGQNKKKNQISATEKAGRCYLERMGTSKRETTASRACDGIKGTKRRSEGERGRKNGEAGAGRDGGGPGREGEGDGGMVRESESQMQR